MSATLTALFWQVGRLLPDISLDPLSPRLRRQFGGLLWVEGPEIAHNVAQGLLRRPGLFPEISAREKALEILERLARARSYRNLHHLFTWLAEACQDGYLREGGTAIKEARTILDRVIRGAEDPTLTPQLDHLSRGRCLMVALMRLEEALCRNTPSTSTRKERSAKKSAAAAASAHGVRVKEERRQEAREQLLDAMRQASRGPARD